MKAKIFAAITVLFGLLTLAGAIYVISNHGEVNPGYAVVPMTFSLAFSNLAQWAKKKDDDKHDTSEE